MANERARGLGYKFVTDDKYLVNPFSPTEGISYAGDGSPVSYANSGIMSGYMTPPPIIYPPIREGGGDGPVDPGPPGSYDSQFDPVTENKEFNEDIGVGTVAEEDDEETKGLSIMDMVRAGGAYMVGGPFNAISSLNKTNNRNKQKEMDKLNAEIAASDAKYGISDARLTAGGASQETMDSYSDGQGGYAGASTEDYGGGEKDGGFIDGTNRRPFNSGGRAGYFFGGRVNYKAGGRIRFQGGGRDAGKDSDFGSENFGGDKDDNREQYGAVGQYSTGPTSTKTNDGGVTKPVFYDKNDNIITTDFISKNPNLTINYTDPRNYASLKSKIGFNNILDNDDITAEGDLTGKFGPVSYNTNFTDKGITETNLTAGNFNAKISPDMQLENLSYSKGPFSISSDGKNTKAGLTFSYKNGGLASIL